MLSSCNYQVSRRRARLRRLLLLSVIIGSFAISATPRRVAGPANINLSGIIIGGTGQHAIYVALWDSKGFLKLPIQQVRIDPRSTPTFHFEIPIGRWALSAFEDMNDNGRLDMGLFGPKEPSGFWRPFTGRRKPHFADVAVQIDQDTDDANIKLTR